MSQPFHIRIEIPDYVFESQDRWDLKAVYDKEVKKAERDLWHDIVKVYAKAVEDGDFPPDPKTEPEKFTSWWARVINHYS